VGKIKKEHLEILLGILVTLFGVWTIILLQPTTHAQTYNETYTVNTTVNITNSGPVVKLVSMGTPINLLAADLVKVSCNATVADFDNETVWVNATFYNDDAVGSTAADDGNNHYSNTSCTRTSNQDIYQNFTCTLYIQYYADNSSNWYCNVTVRDDNNATDSNISQAVTINPLVAIRMNDLIDYGQMVGGQISDEQTANITNVGNRNANISVLGYANTVGDNLAMDCAQGQISVNMEKYDIYNGTSYGFMNTLQGTDTLIQNFYVPQRTSETQESINNTYWRIQIPSGAAGRCNGKLLFTAYDRGD